MSVLVVYLFLVIQAQMRQIKRRRSAKWQGPESVLQNVHLTTHEPGRAHGVTDARKQNPKQLKLLSWDEGDARNVEAGDRSATYAQG